MKQVLVNEDHSIIITVYPYTTNGTRWEVVSGKKHPSLILARALSLKDTNMKVTAWLIANGINPKDMHVLAPELVDSALPGLA